MILMCFCGANLLTQSQLGKMITIFCCCEHLWKEGRNP